MKDLSQMIDEPNNQLMSQSIDESITTKHCPIAVQKIVYQIESINWWVNEWWVNQLMSESIDDFHWWVKWLMSLLPPNTVLLPSRKWSIKLSQSNWVNQSMMSQSMIDEYWLMSQSIDKSIKWVNKPIIHINDEIDKSINDWWVNQMMSQSQSISWWAIS